MHVLTSRSDFLKLTVYVAFFSVLLGFYGLPLHIMRDLFLSFRSFFKRVADFIRYRNATRDMHARYPDATPDEVGREDVCIICREEMRPVALTDDANGAPLRTDPVAERMRPKKLPCGHILHFSCLRSWLERQQNCPTCRRPVVVTPRLQMQAGNHPALPAHAAGQPGVAALPRNVPEQAGRNRARVINFGPLRIGFGAGGGNLIDDLAQRIHNGEQRPLPDPHADLGGQQHLGFGFGFGRRPNPRNQNQAASTAPIQAHLDQIERSLQQQISSMRVASHELHLVRMLNNELLRLRTLQANSANNETAISQLPYGPPSLPPPLGHSRLPPRGYPPPPTMLSSHAQQLLSSDSGALPEGVTLPPGWTLMPLHRYDGPNRSAMNTTAATTTHPTSASVPPPLQATHASLSNQAVNGFTDPLAPRSPPLPTASNGTLLASPVVSPTGPSQAGPGLPSWGSAPVRANGEDLVGQTRDAWPAGNGQADLEAAAAANPADPAEGEGAAEKGKGKAATVENLVDEVD